MLTFNYKSGCSKSLQMYYFGVFTTSLMWIFTVSAINGTDATQLIFNSGCYQ